MAKTVQGVSDKLTELYELQLIDSKIDEIQVFRGELPIEVSDLEDEIVGLEKRVGTLEEKVKEIESEVNAHQANVKESNMLIERYEKQLDEVKNNREFEALSKEISLQKLEIQLSEKKSGEVTKVREAKQVTLDETKERLSQKQENLKIKQVELEKIIDKTNAQEKKLSKKSSAFQKNIEERVLISYQRIRSRYRNGLAVVTVRRDACGGCFNRIPPQLQIEIGLYKNIIACEHCGRVLVDEVLADELEAKLA